jgi:hypothetical protein
MEIGWRRESVAGLQWMVRRQDSVVSTASVLGLVVVIGTALQGCIVSSPSGVDGCVVSTSP